MIERTAPVADAGRMRDGAGDVLLSASRSVHQVATERQAGSHGRRKRAARAVRVPRVDSRHAEFIEHAAIEYEIDDVIR